MPLAVHIHECMIRNVYHTETAVQVFSRHVTAGPGHRFCARGISSLLTDLCGMNQMFQESGRLWHRSLSSREVQHRQLCPWRDSVEHKPDCPGMLHGKLVPSALNEHHTGDLRRQIAEVRLCSLLSTVPMNQAVCVTGSLCRK